MALRALITVERSLLPSSIVMGVDRLKGERRLLSALLKLTREDADESQVRACLQMVASITRARRSYLAVYASEEDEAPMWQLSEGLTSEEANAVQALTSRGIVAAALASGQTIHTPFALLDERFKDRPSVQSRRLEAVLCVPVGKLGGVLYLEGAPDAGPFQPEDVELVTEMGDALGPLLHELAKHAPRAMPNDPTSVWRSQLALDRVVGRSPALVEVFSQVALAAPNQVPVLITGETGTGKTQLARVIHENGPRRNGPFVELNCANFNENLIEAELFGTVAGAFTGATKRRGQVEAAAGGTLFLDEIAELPIAVQARLLHFLQSQRYFAVGSTTEQTANVRFIAATHQPLDKLKSTGKFREDLYFRLNVISIRMPSLRERNGDVPDLVGELLAVIAKELNVTPLRPSHGLLRACRGLELPGNVRELKAKLTLALLRAQHERATQVEAGHLMSSPTDPPAQTFQALTRAFQRDLLLRELEATHWNVSEVARRIDLSRAHLYNLIREFKLQNPNSKET
ncbi:MAG: sigma-54-dependent Fis family transcriptional regulator [Archangium sp.]|nr:sigma-54-dependent Fis family transcriptional regulator [Archangium sp.]